MDFYLKEFVLLSFSYFIYEQKLLEVQEVKQYYKGIIY